MTQEHRTTLMEIDLSSSPFPWWEWDVRSNAVAFNDIKVRCLGYEPADFHGRGYQAFTTLVHPDDHAHTMEAMRDLLSGRSDIYQTLYRIRNISGEYLWFLDRGFTIERHGAAVTRVRGLVLNLGAEVREGSDVEAVVRMMKMMQECPGDFLTTCSTCKRVRTSSGDWTLVTQDFQLILADRLSHGICHDCLHRLYPEMAGRVIAQLARPAAAAITAG